MIEAQQTDTAEATSPSAAELALATHAAHRSALYQAWFDTALEQTRAVFAISSAGVGLSLTLIFESGAKGTDAWDSIWLVFALASFAASAWMCATVFTVNKQIVGLLVQQIDLPTSDQPKNDSTKQEGLARRLHTASKIGFGLGILFYLMAAVAHVWL